MPVDQQHPPLPPDLLAKLQQPEAPTDVTLPDEIFTPLTEAVNPPATTQTPEASPPGTTPQENKATFGSLADRLRAGLTKKGL